jgi:hypothetical protein
MRANGTSGERPPELPDREIWRRSQEIEAPIHEAEQLLDLAALADNRLDDDETQRLAALIARDTDAAGDVAAARLLADATIDDADPNVIARALLAGEDQLEAEVIAFPAGRVVVRPFYSAASWSGLAAAMVLAGWFGFSLGSGLPGVTPAGHAPDEAAANELFDPAPPLILRDFSESSQI